MKVIGYRELTEQDKELMNKIKAKGNELGEIIDEINLLIFQDVNKQMSEMCSSEKYKNDEDLFQTIEHINEPLVFIKQGKLDIQKGISLIIRAIAKPSTFC